MYRNTRIIGLDVIRSVAVLFVLFSHIFTLVKLPGSTFDLQPLCVAWAVYGVELFFVLSGFLIGGILIREYKENGFSGSSLLPFWIRRWFRTLPNYYLFLLVIGAMIVHHGDRVDILRHTVFAQNLFTYNIHPLYSVSWSLCVEEWMYLLLPLVLLLWHRLTGGKQQLSLILTLSTFIVIPLILRLTTTLGATFDEGVRKIVVYRLDAITIGVVLAYAKAYKSRVFEVLSSKYSFLLGMTLSSLLLFTLNPVLRNVDYASTSTLYNGFVLLAADIALALVVAFSSTFQTFKSKSVDSLFIAVSTLSYSVYLFHLAIVLWLAPRVQSLPIPSLLKYALTVILCVAASFGVASAIYKWYEKPMTMLRERWRK